MKVEVERPTGGTGPDRMWLEELYRAHYRPLFRLAMVILGDRSSAEEAVQEAFVRVLRSGKVGPDFTQPAAYLRSTLVNVCRSRLRRQVVARRYRWGASRDAISAEDQALLNEQQANVIRALRGLPRRQRECLALRYYLDLSDSQIGDALGLSTSSVKTHLRRGLGALAKKIEVKT